MKASKWSDRTLTPTIIIVLDSAEARNSILRVYYRKHRDAKLCVLDNSLQLDYRFTMNEVLSLPTFRIRNLSLRLKHRKVIKSIFIRNDTVSVLLHGQQDYTLVSSIPELLELTSSTPASDESSVFFDAVSANSSLE